MARAVTFIINPAAGFGKTRKKLKALVKEIKAQDDKAPILLTHHALHAIALAKQALLQGAERIVVIGGDGTLNEVVNGYFDQEGNPHNPHASLAIVPSGTGSDFARTLDHKQGLREAIQKAAYGEPRMIDVGLVEACDVNGQMMKRYFINVSSLGLSGLVAGFMKNITRKLGSTSAYFLSTLQAIRVFRPPTILLGEEGGQRTTLDNCALISFANGRFFGSGMQIAPNALIDDGFLDVISIKDLSVLFFLTNGYKVYQGTHLELPNVTSIRQRECTVETLSKEPVYVETDGELFAQLPAKFSIKPLALSFIY
jgi:YegS/Rv2252/BmrU family lipid kinase